MFRACLCSLLSKRLRPAFSGQKIAAFQFDNRCERHVFSRFLCHLLRFVGIGTSRITKCFVVFFLRQETECCFQAYPYPSHSSPPCWCDQRLCELGPKNWTTIQGKESVRFGSKALTASHCAHFRLQLTDPCAILIVPSSADIVCDNVGQDRDQQRPDNIDFEEGDLARRERAMR